MRIRYSRSSWSVIVNALSPCSRDTSTSSSVRAAAIHTPSPSRRTRPDRAVTSPPPPRCWFLSPASSRPNCTGPRLETRISGRSSAILPGRLAGRTASTGQQLAGAGVDRRVTQLRHGPHLDLADALPGEVEVLAHLVERAGLAPVEAVAQPEDLALALAQHREQPAHLAGQRGGDRLLGRSRGAAVLDDVGPLGVAGVTAVLERRQRLAGGQER